MKFLIVTDGNLQGTRVLDGDSCEELDESFARVIGCRKTEDGLLQITIDLPEVEPKAGILFVREQPIVEVRRRDV